MKVSILKYNAGNTQSVVFALERIGINASVTNNKDELLTSDKIIFPGVGEASTAMAYLKEHELDKVLINLKQPMLGICLGMQLMCNYSEEGSTTCLGIFNHNVKLFRTNKVPQIGWNKTFEFQTCLFDNIHENEYLYFVHSYYAELGENTTTKTDYGIAYSSTLQKNNFYGVQFHPEKSGDVGQTILENFIKL